MDLELHGCDGSVWHIHGQRAGSQGVALLKGAKGFWEAPIKAVWLQGAFQEGATYVGYKTEPLDVVLPIGIRGDSKTEWEITDSKFRLALGTPDDEVLLVARTGSGRRSITLRIVAEPDLVGEYAPDHNWYSGYIVQARAGWPRWESPAYTDSWTSASGTGSGTVVVSNPTDTPAWLQWVCTAPGRWTLPDYSWPDHTTTGRNITTPTLGVGQDLSIDTYPLHEPYVAMDGSNIAGRFGGVLFQHPLPAHTPPTEIPVSVVGGDDNATCMVRIPRNYRKPRGGDK